MSSTITPSTNQALVAAVSAEEPTTIAEVIARRQVIDTALPLTDGLKSFNRLYLIVSQQVDMAPPGGAWQSPVWLPTLDLAFARYYFCAIRAHLAGHPISASWSALFEARYQSGIARIQFAVAGMNAQHQPRSPPCPARHECLVEYGPCTGRTRVRRL